MTHRFPLASIAAGTTLCFAAPALGEPKPDYEVVVTSTRTPESTQQSTVRTRVVARSEVEKRGATNVAEALAGELGVQVNPSAYGYLGGPSAIQIQGFDRERVLVLEDGERVIGDVGGAIDLSRLPLSDVSQIEYVTGPTSSLYGTGAIGGVVNVITRPPDMPGPSGRGRLEGRSRRGVFAEASGAWRVDDEWAGLDASFMRSDGVALSSDRPDLALPETRSWALGMRGGVSPFRQSEVTLKARFLRHEQLGLISEDVPGLGRFRIDLPETADRFALHAIERLDLGGGSSLSLSIARQWYDATSEKDRVDSPVDESRLRTQRLTGYEATAVIADGPRTWVFGARYEVETARQRLDKLEIVGGEPTPRSAQELAPLTLGSVAGYGQLGWKLERVTIMPGVRAEQHLRFGGVVAPRLAASAYVSDDVMLRASVGRGFRAPSAKEYGFVFDHSFLGYTVSGNSELAPETSWGVNGELSWRPDRRVKLRAGGFANWVRDLIDFRFSRQLPSGVQEYAYVNVGRARTLGVELDVRVRPTPRLSSELGYAYLFARDDTNERPLPSRPAHTLRGRLSAELVFDLRADLLWKAVSDAFVDVGVSAPGFHSLDLRLARRLAPELEAYAGALNVLGTQREPSRIGDQRPIAGRTFYVGVSAELPGRA